DQPDVMAHQPGRRLAAGVHRQTEAEVGDRPEAVRVPVDVELVAEDRVVSHRATFPATRGGVGVGAGGRPAPAPRSWYAPGPALASRARAGGRPAAAVSSGVRPPPPGRPPRTKDVP